MRSDEPNACCASASSSSRCSCVIEFRIRCAAAARCGEGVQELVERARLLGEVVAVLGHEVVELLLGVLALLPRVEQPVEVGEHLVQRGPVLVGRVLERLLHAGEALVEDLPAQEVLDLVELRARLAAAPVVAVELVDGGRGRRREVVELQLRQGTVALVHVDVARQLLALGQDRPVEELLDLLEGAVEVVLLGQLLAAFGDPPRQLVQAGLVPSAAPQELAHRPLGRVARHHVLADRVQRLGEVDRRRERVRPVDVRGVPLRGGGWA